MERLRGLSCRAGDLGRAGPRRLRTGQDHAVAKTYDAAYVALATRVDCALLTLDSRLAGRVSELVVMARPS